MIRVNINGSSFGIPDQRVLKNITAECEISPPVGTKAYEEWRRKKLPMKVEKDKKK